MIDSSDIISIMIVFGLFMVLAGMVGYLAGTTGLSHSGDRSWGHEVDEYDDEDDEEEQEAKEILRRNPPEPEAIPMDPDNPPVTRVFNPRPDRTSLYPICHCHGRMLAPGDEVIWWPIPEEHGGGVRIFHADFIHSMAHQA